MATFQEMFDEYEARGWKRGWAKGWAEGWVEGWRQGLREGWQGRITKLLRIKFGGLVTPELEALVAQGSMEDLERWAVRLLEADSIEAVFAVGEGT